MNQNIFDEQARVPMFTAKQARKIAKAVKQRKKMVKKQEARAK